MNESKHSSHTTEKKEKIYKRSLKNNKNVIKINQNEDNIKEIKRKEEVVNHNYYEYLIFSFPKKERNLFLIEEELNYLDFSESRKWYKIFWSIFKINYDFTNTFFIYNYKDYNDYQIYTIKIMIYVNSVIISILVNIMLYNSETINRIYENKKYNILSRLRIIFISDLAMKFIPILFRYLISYQSILIELKINLNETNKIVKEKNKNDFNNIQNINSSFNTEERLNEDINIKNQDIENYKEIEGEKIKKSVNRNIIIFYIIIIILNFFSWYYASCFCSVYKKTQKFLMLDYALGILLSLLSCLLTSLFYLVFKIMIIQGEYSNLKKYIYKFFHTYITFFMVEKIIELLIAFLITI